MDFRSTPESVINAVKTVLEGSLKKTQEDDKNNKGVLNETEKEMKENFPVLHSYLNDLHFKYDKKNSNENHHAYKSGGEKIKLPVALDPDTYGSKYKYEHHHPVYGVSTFDNLDVLLNHVRNLGSVGKY